MCRERLAPTLALIAGVAILPYATVTEGCVWLGAAVTLVAVALVLIREEHYWKEELRMQRQAIEKARRASQEFGDQQTTRSESNA